jgi:hypothetical protein
MFRYLAVLGRNQREVCCQGNIAVYTIKKNKVRSSNTFEPKGKICALMYICTGVADLDHYHFARSGSKTISMKTDLCPTFY